MELGKVSPDSLLFAYKFYGYLNNHVLGYLIGGSIAFCVRIAAEKGSYARAVASSLAQKTCRSVSERQVEKTALRISFS